MKNKSVVFFVMLLGTLAALTGWASAPGYSVRIEEGKITARLQGDRLEVQLPFRLDGRATGDYNLRVNLWAPDDRTVSSSRCALNKRKAKSDPKFHLPLPLPSGVDRSKMFLYRIQYALLEGQTERQSGIVSLSEALRSINLYVYAQGTYQAGSPASLRVLIKTDSGEDIARGHLQVKLQGKERSLTIFQGKLAAYNYRDLHFKIPENFLGEFDLNVAVQTPYGSEAISKKVSVRKSAKILLTTDKPVYQPGQTIHLRALSLRRGSQAPVAGVPLRFEVEDGRGNKVFKRQGVTDPFGVSSADFKLADEVNYGRFRIRAVLEDESFDDKAAEKTAEVKKYVLPKFKVEWKADAEYYLPGDTVKGKVQVQYFFGKPVTEARVSLKAYEHFAAQTEEPLATLNLTTNSDGRCEVAFQLPDQLYAAESDKRGELRLEISAADGANHEEKISERVAVAKSKILIDAWPEGGRWITNLENVLYVITSYPDGKPAKTSIKIESEDDPDTAVYDETDESGVCAVNWIPDGSQDFKISVTDALGIHAEDEIHLDGQNWGLRVRTDKPVYKVGDTARILILSPNRRGSVFVDFIRDRQTILTKTLELNDGKAEGRLPLSRDFQGMIFINAYAFDPRNLYNHSDRAIVVNPNADLQVDVQPDRAAYKPGHEAKIDLRVSDRAGRPVTAALEVGLVDEAVFALAEKRPGLAKAFFLLETEFLKPRYQIKSLSFPEILENGSDVLALRSASAALSEVNYENDNQRFYIKDQADVRGRRLQALRDAFQPRIMKDLDRIIKAVKDARPSPSRLAQLVADKKIRDPWGENYYCQVYFPTAPTSKIYYFRLASKGPDKTKGTLDDLFIDGALGWHAVYKDGDPYEYHPSLANAIEGIVADIVGGVVPGATLTLTHLNNQQTYTAVSNAEGIYQFAGLIPGVYELKAVAPGFQTGVYKDIIMQEGRSAKVDVHLSVGTATDTLTVTAGAVQLLPSTASASASLLMDVQPGTVQYSVSDSPGGSEPYLRSYFPETLYYNPSLITDAAGRARIHLKLADSITTWRLSALASSLTGALGDQTSGLKVFQDFFVDLDLPVSLTQDDEVSIPVAVYNYLNSPQTVRLKLIPEKWFSLVSGEWEQNLVAEKDRVAVAYFRIKAHKIGRHKLTVYAYGGQMSDALAREIDVAPNGKEFNTVYSDMLNEGIIDREITIPPEAVADASKILVKVYPGYSSQILEGMDGLLHMPYG